MSICSPGSVCIISLKCTEPDPKPVVMTSAGTNHGPVVLQGQSRARENGKRWQWTPVRRGAVDQGSTVQTQGNAALVVGCSRLGGCVWSGLWVTQARGRAQGTVQGTDVAHDRGVGLWAVAIVQGLGSARQRNRLRARVTGRARCTAEVEGRNAGHGGGSQ